MPALPHHINPARFLKKAPVALFALAAASLVALAPAAPNSTPTAPPVAAQPEVPTQLQPQPANQIAPPKPITGKYIAETAIDVRALLPDPAPANSPISNGEIDIILATQAEASPESRARAVAEDNMIVWLFASVLGENFTAEKMPKTAALLKQIERDSKAISDRAKKIWARPRPFEQDSRIKLITEKPNNNSYPSGHATRAMVWSEVLSLLAPDKADAIAARARLIGLDRMILGVHFPTDIAAGTALGKAITEKMKQDPAFQQDLEAARAEWPH